MSGKEGGVSKALSSQTLSTFCFPPPLFPRIFFSISLLYIYIYYYYYFSSHHSFLYLLPQLLLWCWEILTFEAFPIFLNMFHSNKHQSMAQANSAIHNLIFLIYSRLMLTDSSQTVSKQEHFFLYLWPLQTVCKSRGENIFSSHFLKGCSTSEEAGLGSWLVTSLLIHRVE